MPFSAGARLGPYEIVSPLGAGGMGEVYRARDIRLGREVAVKVLPASMAHDPERLARFEQEARATAALNHPNILALYDIGTFAPTGAFGAPYLVAELLDGETLRDRLGRGTLPQRRAIEIATQIAAGLAAAHDKGIAHRDLKPENVFVTTDGHVKILDFGLAKVTTAATDTGPADMGPADMGPAKAGHYVPSALATAAPGTSPGVVLGTVGYMAPEQVKGLPADHRSDIFALGAMLYEMLSGRRAFQRDTAPETMTAILNEEPPESLLSQQSVPPALDRIVSRCLEKSPSARFQSTRDLAFALEGLSSQSDLAAASGKWRTPRTPPARTRERALALVVILLLLTTAALVYVVRRPAAMPVVAFTVAGPAESAMQAFSLSPDGRTLAFVATPRGQQPAVFVRRLDSVDATLLTGTAGGRNPFWSPDGRSIGFFADRTLKTIPAAGGPVRVIIKADGARTWGTWNDAGVILFSTEDKVPIRQVPADGGAPSVVTRIEVAPRPFRPMFLPGGRRFLYFNGDSTRLGRGELRIASLDSPDDAVVLDGVGWGQYVEPGYLVFVRGAELLAQPFDVSTGRVTGRALTVGRVGDDFNSASNTTSSGFSATSGTLAFRTVDPARDTALIWFDRRGTRGGTVGEPANYRNVQLSPDGSRLAVQRRSANNEGPEIWTYDVNRNVGTVDVAGALMPVWSRAGDLFMLRRPGGLATVPAGGGKAEKVPGETPGEPNSVSPDGRFLAFTSLNPVTNRDIGFIPVAGGAPTFMANSTADEVHAQINPNGRWVAYESNEPGTNEIYVQRFPSGGGKVRVSSNGGVQPRWRRDGRELYYVVPAGVGGDQNGEGRMVAVPFDDTTDLQLGQPLTLFEGRFWFTGGLGTIANYDVTADGQRFLVATPTGTREEAPIAVITNWQSLLAR
jgi:serine/threonine protein kinase/Tol biopolymer transport system component